MRSIANCNIVRTIQHDYDVNMQWDFYVTQHQKSATYRMYRGEFMVQCYLFRSVHRVVASPGTPFTTDGCLRTLGCKPSQNGNFGKWTMKTLFIYLNPYIWYFLSYLRVFGPKQKILRVEMIEIYLENPVFHESPFLSWWVLGGNTVLQKDIININVLKKKSERSRKIQRCGVLKNPIFDLKIQFFLYSRGSFLNILDQNLVS